MRRENHFAHYWLVLLTALGLSLPKVGRVVPAQGLEGPVRSSLALFQLGLFEPGSPTTSPEESSPAESDDPDSEDAQDESDDSSGRVEEHFAPRRAAWCLPAKAAHRADHCRLAVAGGLRPSVVTSCAGASSGLPVLLCRLTC